MRYNTAGLLAAVATLAVAKPTPEQSTSVDWTTKYDVTAVADVQAAAATAKTSVSTSHVKGKAFDRIAIIWFENTDYNKAFHDPNFRHFAKHGQTLTNYFAVTHPSQPNYIASIAGDHFGMNHDDFTAIPSNVSTVIDLLEDAGISWSVYQEDMPFSGFEGMYYKNAELGNANDYVRKHNPPVTFNSATETEHRLSLMKNLSMIDKERSQFHKELANNELPQWMFITPNMTSDAHDSNIMVAGKWLRAFMDPLMDDPNFMQRTLVLITFDENETYAQQNQIFAMLLGDALPKHLIGKSDDSFYNHYSEIATVGANWKLPTLGRWDVGANVFKWVARKTCNKVRKFHDVIDSNYFWNSSYDGACNRYNDGAPYPAPNLDLDESSCGRPISKQVKKLWKHSDSPTYYKDSVKNDDGLNPPKGFEPPSH